MINVQYSLYENSAELKLEGHALYAPKGKDIVCAAVSGLCIALNDTLDADEKADSGSFSRSSFISDGAFDIKVCDFSDTGTALRVLSYFTLAVTGLEAIQKMYPDSVRVKTGITPIGTDNIGTSEQTMTKREKGSSMTENVKLLQHFAEDSSDGGETDASAAQNTEENSLTAEEEFENLIKGKYSDAFKKRTQGIIDRRFAKMKGYENTAKVCLPLIERLAETYPHIDKNDTEALVQSFLSEKKKSDAENEKQEAFGAVSEKIEKALAEKAAQKLSLYLREEADKLREIYPGFELSRELSSSPEMRRLLLSGVGLRRAYETVNLEKILASSMRYAAIKAGKSAADSVRSSRVQENSLSGNAASVGRTDVKSLTEKDIMRILSEVSRGAKISFK